MTILDAIREDNARARADAAQLRLDVQALGARVDDGFHRVDLRFRDLEQRVGDVKSDLMKWSFLFWVGAVSAIALLAGVLER